MTKENLVHSPQDEQPEIHSEPKAEISNKTAGDAHASSSAPITSVIKSKPPKKKRKARNLLWMWITIGIVLLVAIATTTVLLVAKSGADTAAKNYRVAAKTYLSEVYDSAVGSSEKPNEIIDDIEGTQVPILESAFLGDLSSDYVKAEELRGDIEDAVTELTNKINGYQAVYDLYKDISDLDDDAYDALDDMYYAETEAEIQAIFTQFSEMLDKQISIVENAKLPSDLGQTQTDIINSVKVCRDAWSGIVTAYQASNASAVEKYYTEYQTCTKDVEKAFEKFEDYYNDLSAKFRESAKPIRNLNNNIR